jgi:hypothetical protein
MTEVIRNQKAVETLFIDMIKAAEQGLLLIFPTANSFLREERLGIIHLLRYGAIGIKILTPIDILISTRYIEKRKIESAL